MLKKISIIIILFCLLPFSLAGQNIDITDGITLSTELQASASSGKTPLWLNANKYGLSSLEEYNGYLRGAAIRPIEQDSNHIWGIGYGVDLAIPVNYTSKFIVQQAYIEGRWHKMQLTIGSKEYPAELKNNALSSGAQTLGINARPVPQIRVALPEYWPAKGWFHMKGHLAYGKITDDNWQEDFTNKESRYSNSLYYHSKAGYAKFGKNDSHFNLEFGLEMACIFGGTNYQVANGKVTPIEGGRGLEAIWNSFVPTGIDAGENFYTNTAGDHLGSWLLRGNYKSDDWGVSLYYDKFFEDHSAMFNVDFDGYGHGDEWNDRVDSHFRVHSFRDMLLGVELNLNKVSWLNSLVFEYLYTKYQSGPIFHNRSTTISDHIGGRDNFYNHHVYTGWQHWGQVIGNPLYLSPIYNEDGTIEVKNNRFIAYHMGATGQLAKGLNYRVLATYQKGWGTYYDPYLEPEHNFCFLTEATYSWGSNWNITGAYAMDLGGIMGNNKGFQLTARKSILLKKKGHTK